MARNGSGVYSLPGTYLAVSGETIEAQQHNDPLEDLEADANNARPVVAGGTGATSAADARTNLDVPSNAQLAAAAVPTGSVMSFAGSTVPTGWLLCDGAAVSRTTYADLFDAIGETYGAGNGTTTFNLPDMGGRVPVGYESTPSRVTQAVSGITTSTVGSSGGAQSKTLSQGNLPSVSLSSSGLSVQPTVITGVSLTKSIDNDGQAGGGTSYLRAATDLSVTTDTSADITGSVPLGGSDTPFSIVQPSITMKYIIKT